MTDEGETPNQESANVEAGEGRPLSLLAYQMYGANYHGSPQEESEPSNPDDPNSEDSGDETLKPENEDSDEEKGESEGEDSGEGEENDEDEGEPITSFDDLVEHNEWDPDWAQSLHVPIKVDGESSEVPIKDLVANYQMNQAADKRLEEAKEAVRSAQAEAEQKRNQINEQYAVAAKLLEGFEQDLESEVSRINWEQLREDDPAEYSAKKAEIQEKRERIEAKKKEAKEQFQQAVQQHQQDSEQAKQEKLQQEQEQLLKVVPEWSDPKVAEKEQPQVAQFLRDSGFSGDELEVLASDHRAVVMARKAMLFDNTQSKTEAAKKKVRKVPKMTKPGASKPKEHVEREKVQRAESRFKKSRKLDDAFELLKTRRVGG